MKIGILVSDFPPNMIGGTETQSLNLAKELAKTHDVTVYTRHYGGQPFSEESGGFSIKRFRFVNLPVFRFLSHIICSLGLIRKERPDVLVCMMLTPNGLVGVLAKKLSGIISIPWVRGGDWYLTGFVGRRITSLVIRKSPVVLAQTEKIRSEILAEFPESNIRVVPNGISPGGVSKGNNILFVGNLIERKGVRYLIEAMRGLDERLIIVGDGPLRKGLENMAGNNIEFVGEASHEEVKRYLKTAKMFVLPSVRGEGMPNAIIEAMSFGVPVIATRIAGIPDMVKDGKTGFLVDPGKPEQIRKHIKYLIAKKELRMEMSRNCITESRKYSWDMVIPRLISVLKEVSCAE